MPAAKVATNEALCRCLKRKITEFELGFKSNIIRRSSLSCPGKIRHPF